MLASLPIWLLPYRLRRWLIQRGVNYSLRHNRAKWIHLKGQLYLERYSLYEGPRGCVFLHRFHRPDDDRGPHNHPWRWAASLILTGGYLESRVESSGTPVEEYGRFGRRTRHRGRLNTRVFTVGDINTIKSSDEFHRIAHLLDTRSALSLGGKTPFEPEVWTLFISGPKHGNSWGYLIDWVYKRKRDEGGCRACPYGSEICQTDPGANIGTEEIPIYLDECIRPPEGWRCTRGLDHEGPCAAWPVRT